MKPPFRINLIEHTSLLNVHVKLFDPIVWSEHGYNSCSNILHSIFLYSNENSCQEMFLSVEFLIVTHTRTQKKKQWNPCIVLLITPFPINKKKTCFFMFLFFVVDWHFFNFKTQSLVEIE